jgi:hypothetical protein
VIGGLPSALGDGVALDVDHVLRDADAVDVAGITNELG